MTTMKHAMLSVSALLLSVSVLLMGNGLLGILLPVRAGMESFAGLDIGILGSSYFIGFTLGCLFGPVLISRVGHIRTYLAFVSVASIATLLHAVTTEPWLWWLFRAATGLCFSVLFIVIESWLNERSTNETRATIFSIYMVINLTVLMIGQTMLMLADPKAFQLFALAAILFSLAALPVAMTRSQSPEPIPVVKPRLFRLYGLSPVGALGCLSVGLANGAFWSLGPVFATDRGLDNQGIALLMSAVVLGGAIGQWPLGRISDLMDRRYVILAGCIFAGLSGLALSLWPVTGTSTDGSLNASMLYLLAFCFGVFALPLYALTVAHANDYTAPGDYVETSSGLLLLLGIGSSIGPTLSSIFDTMSPRSELFTYTAAVHFLIAGFVLWRMRQRSAVDIDEKGEFRDALVAAQTFAPLEDLQPADPHAESTTKAAAE